MFDTLKNHLPNHSLSLQASEGHFGASVVPEMQLLFRLVCSFPKIVIKEHHVLEGLKNRCVFWQLWRAGIRSRCQQN